MDAQKKNTRFRSIVSGKPQVDHNVRVTLSQFQATSSVTNRHRLTVSDITKVVNYHTGLAKLSEEQLVEELNIACSQGYLEREGSLYELTAKGIDVTGESRTESEHLQDLGVKGIKYRNGR